MVPQPESRSSIGSGGENDNSKCREPGPGRADKKQVQKFECRAIARLQAPLHRASWSQDARPTGSPTTPTRTNDPPPRPAADPGVNRGQRPLPQVHRQWFAHLAAAIHVAEQRVRNVPLWESLFNLRQRMGAAPARSVFSAVTAADYPLECHELATEEGWRRLCGPVLSPARLPGQRSDARDSEHLAWVDPVWVTQHGLVGLEDLVVAAPVTEVFLQADCSRGYRPFQRRNTGSLASALRRSPRPWQRPLCCRQRGSPSPPPRLRSCRKASRCPRRSQP